MRDDRSDEACYVLIDDTGRVERRGARRRYFQADENVVDPWSYHAKRGRGTIRLSLVEYRILNFLASRPNEACTRSRIAAAVSSRSYNVTADSLSRHIHSLRGQLGFYSDYIQSVPYIGYRFKG